MKNFEANANQEFFNLVNAVMPFGKYQGTRLIELPETYVIWAKNHLDMNHDLAKKIHLLYEIKLNGLEYLFKDFH